jgi:uncharacterized damage-inducible protein DinB
VTGSIIRPAFPRWPDHNRRLRDRVANLTPEQLAIKPSPDRWPLWATIGHLACQRVFWLCDFAGEPGAAESPFPNAGFDCPGDDDLEHVWSAERLVDALDRTFAIVERCLDTWTIESLDEVIDRSRDWGDPSRVHTRGWVIQGSLAHDVWHTAEVNEALTRAGLAPINLWE